MSEQVQDAWCVALMGSEAAHPAVLTAAKNKLGRSDYVTREGTK